MENNSKKILAVGFIVYGDSTAKYLPFFLPSLKAQTENNFLLMAVDNSESEDNANALLLKAEYPEVELVWAGGNIGFARAGNFLINKAIKAGCKYFLILNPDIVLQPAAIEKMLAAISNANQPAAVSPKILYWDFTNNKKTNIIDSLGIKLRRGLRFVDLGQGEIDRGQYDEAEIIGPSGAAGLYRLEALRAVARGQAYFDEDMFMYKEDCDLAYRLAIAGFKSVIAKEAVVYHARTAVGKGESDLSAVLSRKQKSRQIKEWSLQNQLIIYRKYWARQGIIDKIAIVIRLIKIIFYALIFERYLLKIILPFLKKLIKNLVVHQS